MAFRLAPKPGAHTFVSHQVAGQAPGGHAIDLFELARHVRLIAEACRLRNLHQFRSTTDQLAGTRETPHGLKKSV